MKRPVECRKTASYAKRSSRASLSGQFPVIWSLSAPKQVSYPLVSRPLLPGPHNVKHWQGGDMRLRWAAGGMLSAEEQFRRIDGYRQLPQLAKALHYAIGAVHIESTIAQPA